MFHMPQGWELIIILGFGLLLFGKKLPEVGRGLGQSIVEFKKGLKGVQDDVEKAEREADKQVAKGNDPAQLT